MGGKNSLKVINHDQKLFIEWVDGFLSSFINVSKLEFCRFYSIKFIFGPPVWNPPGTLMWAQFLALFE